MNTVSCGDVCGVIPAYQAARTIQSLVEEVRQYLNRVIVVDDGSKDGTATRAEAAGATVLRHPVNRGKGAALRTGLAYCLEHPCEFVLTMDADGQHLPEMIPCFLRAYQRTHIPVLVGNRMADSHRMPLLRRRTNQIMSRWISRVTHQYVPDSQCGYRLFHQSVLPYLFAESNRFAAESEVLLHLADRGIRIDSVRIPVIYGRNQRSSIRPARDTLQFLQMLHHHYRRKRIHRTRGMLHYPDG